MISKSVGREEELAQREKRRVLGKLRGGRLISELISLSVVSECTFYAVLDNFSTRGYGKNCPVKIF